MPSFTFTADPASDQLNIVGHGLNTGDGPAAVRNIGGALPAATPALAPVTDYWIIRDDADRVRLATSSSNAYAGIAIDITSAGTGTQLLQIGLPYRRPRTAAKDGQIFSADANATWDSLVALNALLTGQPQTVWSGIEIAGEIYHGDRPMVVDGAAFRPYNNSAPLTPNYGAVGAGGAIGWTFGAVPNDSIRAWVQLPVGTRIKSVTWRLDKNSNAAGIFMAIGVTGANQSPVTKASITDTTATAGIKPLSLSPFSPFTLGADESLWLLVVTNGPARFYAASLVFDRPRPA